MRKIQQVHVTSLNEYKSALEQLCEHNPDYDLTAAELAQQGKVGARIYENLYKAGEVSLKVPADSADSLAVDVIADGLCIGHVKRSEGAQVRAWLEKGAVLSVRADIQGGPYRIVDADSEGHISLDEGSAGLFAMLDVETEEHEESFADGSSDTAAYISTSYATEFLEKKKRGRGNAALMFSAMVTAFYLGFFIPYWILIWTGAAAPLDVLGGAVSRSAILIHLILTGCAFVLAVIAFFMHGCAIPLLCAALYAAGVSVVPGYALFIALPCIGCLAAAFRRKSTHRVMTVIRVVVLAACLVCLFVDIRPVVMNAIEQRSLVIRPLNDYSASGDSSDGLTDGLDDGSYDYEYATGDHSDEIYDADADKLNSSDETNAGVENFDDDITVIYDDDTQTDQTDSESSAGSNRSYPILRPGALLGEGQ